jgi:hypothetical protein
MSRIKITLDKNYNFVENKSVYNDDFVDAVDLISKAQSDKVITENEANLLFKIVLKKEFKKEVKKHYTAYITNTRNSLVFYEYEI